MAAAASTSSNQAPAIPAPAPAAAPAPKPAPPPPQPFKPGTKFYILAGQRDKPGATDGQGSVARFNNPMGLAFGQGELYVADTGNEIIRKITTNGLTSTVAGSLGISGGIGGLARNARFSRPEGILVVAVEIFWWWIPTTTPFAPSPKTTKSGLGPVKLDAKAAPMALK